MNSTTIWIEGGIILTDKKRYKEKKCVVVDIGGLTVDTIEFIYGATGANKTLKVKGILQLETELMDEFNLRNNLILKDESVDELISCVINNKSFKLATYEIRNLDEYKKIIDYYINKIINEINISFSLEDKEIIFIGGGAIKLKSKLEELGKTYNITIIDNQHINQNVYEYLAKSKEILDKNEED